MAAQIKRKPIGERIIERFGGVTKEVLTQVRNRAYEAGWSDANDEPPSGDLKSYGYQRAVTGTLRDFHGMPADKVFETIWTLWQSSPIAKRVIKIKRSYVLGKGITPHADNDELQTILTDFMDRNNLDADGRRANEFTEQLFLFGEQLYPVFVQESSGAVSLGYIDPGKIEKVIMHPENALDVWAVVLKEVAVNEIENPWEKGRAKRVYRLVREAEKGEYEGRLITATQAEKMNLLEPWELAMLKHYGLKEYSGSALLTQINKVSNQERGYSDLLQVADWIDQADQTLFALADREQMAGYFFIDVTVEETQPGDVDMVSKRVSKNPPKPGAANIHNQSETWKIEQPDLKQEGSVSTLIALMTFIMGGMGFPLAWYGYGDDTNRATLEEQGTPSHRQLEDDQGVVRSMFLRMLTFARDQAIIAGYYTPTDETEEKLDLPMPEMTSKDLSRIMGVFAPLVNALLLARDGQILGEETVREAVAKVLKEMDIEINVQEEQDEIDASNLDDEQANNDELNTRLQVVGNGKVKA